MAGGICRSTAPKLDTQIVRHATAVGALTAPTPHSEGSALAIEYRIVRRYVTTPEEA